MKAPVYFLSYIPGSRTAGHEFLLCKSRGLGRLVLAPATDYLVTVSPSVLCDSATPWTAACRAPLSVEFSRQEYWSGYHSLLQGIFLAQGLNPHLLHWQADSLPSEPPGRPLEQTKEAAKRTAVRPFRKTV